MAKSKSRIQYNIAEIKRLSHFENDITELGFTGSDIHSIELNVLVTIIEKESRIKFETEVIFIIDKNKDKIHCFGGKTLHSFKITNMSKIFPKDENNKIQIPADFMKTLLRIVVGSTRGILAISTTNKEYSNIYFPVIPDDILLHAVQYDENE